MVMNDIKTYQKDANINKVVKIVYSIVFITIVDQRAEKLSLSKIAASEAFTNINIPYEK